MIRVHVFCEGQTEETFVNEVLKDHFSTMEIWSTPIVIRTSKQSKGGAVSYGKIKRQIEQKCKEDQSAWITTLLDFYGLPSGFPGMQIPHNNSLEKVQTIVSEFKRDIDQLNFIPNLVLHEFEGLLFSDPVAFSKYFNEAEIVEKLMAIRQQFDSPEQINDGQQTAPSKRILSLCDRYEKVLHGTLIALDIGLATMRRECPFFDGWIKTLENLPR